MLALNFVVHWGDSITRDHEYTFRIEDMSLFQHAVDELKDCFGSCPVHKQRVDEIVKLLKAGEPQLPCVWLSRESVLSQRLLFGNMLEGLHRLLAFHQLNLPTVPVIYFYENELEDDGAT